MSCICIRNGQTALITMTGTRYRVLRQTGTGFNRHRVDDNGPLGEIHYMTGVADHYQRQRRLQWSTISQ